ncbi:Sugar-phosphate stress protein SgrT (embedded in SgrS), partial [Salmonella enterica subsp. enterica serovar Enteritidis]
APVLVEIFCRDGKNVLAGLPERAAALKNARGTDAVGGDRL